MLSYSISHVWKISQSFSIETIEDWSNICIFVCHHLNGNRVQTKKGHAINKMQDVNIKGFVPTHKLTQTQMEVEIVISIVHRRRS